MRRIDRIRFERRRQFALVFGLAFALGALTAGGLLWRTDYLAAGVTEEVEATLQQEERPTEVDAGAPALSAAPAATSGSTSDDVTRFLRMKRLSMPVDGVSPSQLRDTFEESRAAGLRKHEAIDIMAPRGTPVRAVEDARVSKLFKSVAGGLTIYLSDPSEAFTYYYAHLDRYAQGLREEQRVGRGELIGYVGSTGNASEDAPHLHFAVFQMGPERRWWQGEPINPFPLLGQR